MISEKNKNRVNSFLLKKITKKKIILACDIYLNNKILHENEIINYYIGAK